MKLARIHPPNTSRGFFAHTYLLSGSGYPKFEARKGWYEVDDGFADKTLRPLLNNPDDPHSRPVFQICTVAEARALEEAEKEIIAVADAPIPAPKKKRDVEWPDDMAAPATPPEPEEPEASDDSIVVDGVKYRETADDGADEPPPPPPPAAKPPRKKAKAKPRKKTKSKGK